MASIPARQQEIVTLFTALPGWEDRYRKIIEMGKALAPMPEAHKTDAAKVKGCQSQVWLHSELSAEGRVQLEGDSDALIVRGLVALLLRVYADASPDEILQYPPNFLQELGFAGNLSPSRTNGLNSMIRQIQHFAVAYRALLAQKKASH